MKKANPQRFHTVWLLIWQCWNDKKIFLIYLFLAALGLHCCASYSLVAASRGYTLVLTEASVCCRAWAQGSQASVAAALEHRLHSCGCGLSCPKPFGIFPDQGWNRVSCIGRWILYQWTTREAPGLIIFYLSGSDTQFIWGLWKHSHNIFLTAEYYYSHFKMRKLRLRD